MHNNHVCIWYIHRDMQYIHVYMLYTARNVYIMEFGEIYGDMEIRKGGADKKLAMTESRSSKTTESSSSEETTESTSLKRQSQLRWKDRVNFVWKDRVKTGHEEGRRHTRRADAVKIVCWFLEIVSSSWPRWDIENNWFQWLVSLPRRDIESSSLSAVDCLVEILRCAAPLKAGKSRQVHCITEKLHRRVHCDIETLKRLILIACY